MNTWDAVCKFIRLRHRGMLFTRFALVSYVIRNVGTNINERTIDVYRSILTKQGYLRIVRRGTYEVLRTPEDDLTYTLAKNLDYSVVSSQSELLETLRAKLLNEEENNDFIKEEEFQI